MSYPRFSDMPLNPKTIKDLMVYVYYLEQVDEFNKKNNATVVYDIRSVSAYSYVDSSWVGYDDVKSTTTKVEFAQAIGLRGYFFWALSYDSADWQISTHG